MKVTYHTPEKLKEMLDAQHLVVDAHLAKAKEAHEIAEQLFEAFEESVERSHMGLPVGVTVEEDIDPVEEKILTLSRSEILEKLKNVPEGPMKYATATTRWLRGHLLACVEDGLVPVEAI